MESLIYSSKQVTTTVSVPTNEEILSSVLAGYNNVDDDESQPGDTDFDTEGPNSPSWDELEWTLDAIEDAPFSSQYEEERKSLVMKMQNSLRCAKVENLKQTFTSYFQKLKINFPKENKVFFKKLHLVRDFKTNFSISRILDISKSFLYVLEPRDIDSLLYQV